jgi:predicted nucleotidyltransferase
MIARVMDRTRALNIARDVAAIVRRIIGNPAYRVVLFGSWAEGCARQRSDIDVGIDGPTSVDPVLMQEIREVCERLPTLHTIDLVDFATLPDHVRADARAHAVPVTVEAVDGG